MTTDMTFAEWLRLEMESRHLKPADISRAAGIDPATIHNLINQKRNLGPDIALALADAMEIPAAEIFYRAGLFRQKDLEYFKTTHIIREIYRESPLTELDREILTLITDTDDGFKRALITTIKAWLNLYTHLKR